jgi:hypothetical protein
MEILAYIQGPRSCADFALETERRRTDEQKNCKKCLCSRDSR